MSDFDVARWRPAPFLPESDARDGSLTFVVAVLYTLPNFFGEAPAVQVSAGKVTAKVDSGTLSRVESSQDW